MKSISAGTVLRLERAAGTHIVIRAGRAWITETGNIDDIGLDAGQSYRIAGRGRVLVESLGRPGDAPMTLSLVPAAPATGIGRLLSRLGLRPLRFRA